MLKGMFFYMSRGLYFGGFGICFEAYLGGYGTCLRHVLEIL
jgi:hypothetical protein